MIRTRRAASLALLLALSFTGCASAGGARHVATVTVVSAHATLSALQDGEVAIACGKPTAPDPPLCIPAAVHRVINEKLAIAFKLDGDLARLVRAAPVTQPLPADIAALVERISALVNDILKLLPAGQPSASLKQRLGAQ